VPSLAATSISGQIFGAYSSGRGGPGGWWILAEPEIHFELDKEVSVPDVAGWRRDRMPSIPDSHKFQVVPDWICEVLSPSTESVDREIKMPLYARYGVSYLWLVHPAKMTLEVFTLKNGHYQTQALLTAEDSVCIPPFESTTFTLNDLLGII